VRDSELTFDRDAPVLTGEPLRWSSHIRIYPLSGGYGPFSIRKRLEGARWPCPKCAAADGVAIWFEHRGYSKSWARCTKCRWREKFANFRKGVDLAAALGAPSPR
jgi:Zn ribbon nucleic-acid-binding protein